MYWYNRIITCYVFYLRLCSASPVANKKSEKTLSRRRVFTCQPSGLSSAGKQINSPLFQRQWLDACHSPRDSERGQLKVFLLVVIILSGVNAERRPISTPHESRAVVSHLRNKHPRFERGVASGDLRPLTFRATEMHYRHVFGTETSPPRDCFRSRVPSEGATTDRDSRYIYISVVYSPVSTCQGQETNRGAVVLVFESCGGSRRERAS